jgi:hypothetical protein
LRGPDAFLNGLREGYKCKLQANLREKEATQRKQSVYKWALDFVSVSTV